MGHTFLGLPMSQDAMIVAEVKMAWAMRNPTRRKVGEVVTEHMSLKVFGNGNIFERGTHVPVTNMGYFKPPTNVFLLPL